MKSQYVKKTWFSYSCGYMTHAREQNKTRNKTFLTKGGGVP